MNKAINPATVGAMVRDARMAAGISQIELGQRIGASRFWVAQFEKGKPSAELGLALKALHALGLRLVVEPRGTEHAHDLKAQTQSSMSQPKLPSIDLKRIISTTMVREEKNATPWVVAPARKTSSKRKSRQR